VSFSIARQGWRDRSSQNDCLWTAIPEADQPTCARRNTGWGDLTGCHVCTNLPRFNARPIQHRSPGQDRACFN